MPPRTDVKIVGFIGGDDLSVIVDVLNIPAGIQLAKAWMTVKVALTDADPGVFQKAITNSANADGQITDIGAGGHGILLFLLVPNDTQVKMTVGKTYAFDVQVKFTDGRIATIEVGTIVFSQGATVTTT